MNAKKLLGSFVMVSGVLLVSACRSGTDTPAVPPPPASTFNVTLTKGAGGTGTGSVVSSPTGINCNASCNGPITQSFPVGTLVRLTATATAGHVFAGWGGDCAGASVCDVTSSGTAVNVTATFNVQQPLGEVIGLTTNNHIVSFNRSTPEAIRTDSLITGLATDEQIIGIDYRPLATGSVLYGISNQGALYQINPSTGVASLKRMLAPDVAGDTAAPFFVAFNSAASYAMDFNPVADKLRLVGSDGSNLRIDVAPAGVSDKALVSADTALNIEGTASSATAAAYTHNYAGAKGTVLFVINTQTDKLYIQNPPGDGALVEVGALGVDVDDANGFDITGTNLDAVALLNVSGVARLYLIDLISGAATLVGSVNPSAGPMRGVALVPGAPPASVAGDAWALTADNQLITFSRATPATIASAGKVVGMASGENLVGLEYRPKNGALYGVSSRGILYTLNPNNALVTRVAALTGAGFGGLSGTSFDLGFRGGKLTPDTGTDHLRLVGNSAQNLRINADDGVVIVDSKTNVGGGTPSPSNPSGAVDIGVTGVAYDNEFDGTNPLTGGAGGSGQSTMYGITPSNNMLVRFAYAAGSGPTGAPPYRATNLGSLNLTAQSVGGLEIDGLNNAAYTAIQISDNGSLVTNLYRVNLASGATQLVDKIGSGSSAVRGLTLKPATRPMVFAIDAATNKLIKFLWDTPNNLLLNVALAGTGSNALGSSEKMISLSFRQTDGKLFGVSTSDNLYEIDPASGVLTNKRSLTRSINDPNSPFSSIGTQAMGMDFDPAAANGANLRLLSAVAASNNNLRIDANNGETFTDTNLTNADTMADIAADAITYDFGFNGSLGSTAYVVSIADNFLYSLGNPNPSDGQMVQIDPTTPMFGDLGATPTPDFVAMDTVGGNNGMSLLATYSATDGSLLWRLDLGSGALTALGAPTNAIGGAGIIVRGLAIQLLPVP